MGMETLVVGSLLAGAGASIYAANKDSESRSDATQAAVDQRNQSQAFIEKNMNQARNDILNLYPSIQDSQRQGFNASLDLYKKSIPMRMNAFTQGNIGAQNQIIKGLPQIQNALLGRKIDTSGFQPQSIGYSGDTSLPQSPQFQGISSAIGQKPAQPTINPELMNYMASLQQQYGGY